MLWILAAIMAVLLTAPVSFGATIVPAFGTFSSSAGGKLNAGQLNNNTMRIVASALAKVDGKPTISPGPQVNIDFYHYAADGNDYKPALTRAIAAYPNGANITFPSGTFDLSPDATFNAVSNITITGQGASTIIRPKWNGSLPYVSAHLIQFTNSSDITVQNLHFAGRVAEGMDDLHPQSLWFIGCSNITIQNNKFDDMNRQDRSAIGIYSTHNYKVLFNTILNADVGVMTYNSNSGQNMIIGNTISGGFSEGIAIYTDSTDVGGGAQTTAARSTIVALNQVSDKDSTCVNVYNSANAGVIIYANIFQALTRNDFSGIVLQNSTGVDVVANHFMGPFVGVNLYGQSDDNRIIGNRFLYSTSLVANGGNSNVLSGVEISGNTYIGPVNIPAYSALKTYFKGEMVSSGGVYYQSIVDSNLGAAVGDTSKWIPPSAAYTLQAVISANLSNVKIERNTIKDAVTIAISPGTGTDKVSIVDNKVLNSSRALYYSPGSSAVISDLVVRGNYFEGTSGASSTVSLNGYKITKSIFANNTVTTTSTPEPWNGNTNVVELSTMTGNIFKGGGSYSFAEFGGCWAKSNNIFEKLPSSSRYKDVPLNGYVQVGQRFEIRAPTADTSWICTTAGYAYKEAYNAAHSYSLGEYVLGSDSKVYECILADSGSAANAPVTGGNYATYWQKVGGTGLPVAVFKSFGTVDISSSLSSLGQLSLAGGLFTVDPFTSGTDAIADFNLYPLDGSSSAAVRFFRSVNTTGFPGVDIYRGDGSGTINNHLAGRGNTYLAAATGNVCIGATGCSEKLHVAGSATIENDLGVTGNINVAFHTPATSSAACSTGTVNFDASYVYVCTTTNTWKRAGLASW